MTQTIDQVFRDHQILGNPSSGAHSPSKADIRALLKMIQNSGGLAVTRNTLTALQAITPPNENYMGVVLTGTGAGYYYRSGGAWVFGRPFPDTFAEVVLSGTGTTQTGALNTDVNPAGVEVFYARVTTPNTGQLTLSIAGGAARSVRNIAGNPLSAGEWTGLVMFYLNDADQYQLLLDAGAAASAAASATLAEAAADSASDSQEAAASSAGTALAAKLAAEAAAEVSGNVVFFDTKAAATAAVGSLPDLQIVEVIADESRSGVRARYRKESGSLVFKVDMAPDTILGQFQIATKGNRIGITSGDEPLGVISAITHIVNEGDSTCGLRVQSYWTGTAEVGYENNDDSLFEVFNTVESTGYNLSWAGSFCNGFNDIPAGVKDSGYRVGVKGWATSVCGPTAYGYEHRGVLELQIGVWGTAGFQGSGDLGTPEINAAIGVYGYIHNDIEGATIYDARAGQFVSTAATGIVHDNYAIYAEARNGINNYAFYGGAGDFHQEGDARFVGQVVVGTSNAGQSSPDISARNGGNAFEFGNADADGYGSNLGATEPTGMPFLALCAEADASGDTFTTRGKLGTVIHNDLSGALVFSRLTSSNAAGQSLTESARFAPDGQLQLSKRPQWPGFTPASSSATGTTGEVSWDPDYIYVCVATDTWKRVALEDW